MHTKKEAALAGAAATMSGELDEADLNLYAPQKIDKYQLQTDEFLGPGTPVDRILSRLGCAVLLPIQTDKKCPTLTDWQNTTQAAMFDPTYVAKLNTGGNIGVLLGAASNGLCTIDIDHDNEVEQFLALNSVLRHALQTRRARGVNIWVRIEGEYPPLTKLKTRSGNSWGEWRANGSQTVIYGVAWDASLGETEPVPYRFVQDGKPVVIRFDQIVWPEHLLPPRMKPTPDTFERRDVPMPEVDAGDGIIILPSDVVGFRECADKLFCRIARTYTLFQRAGTLVETHEDDDGNIRLNVVSPAGFRSRIEGYGKLMAWRSGEGRGLVLKPVPCPEETAKGLIETLELQEHLPRISTLIGCPVLIQTGANKLSILPPGYHPENGGILVTGGEIPPEVEFDVAVAEIVALLDEFVFQTAGDRSRALTQFLTPTMRLGGFITGYVPADVAEADQSQSGKTYRQRLVAALYNETPKMIVRRDGGVGSTDESFAQALIAGRPFIQFDNLRGKLDSQFIEAFLTAVGGFAARVPYRGEVLIDPTRYFLQLTSNGVETTRDMANRSCIIRIRKRPDHAFRRYDDGGDLLGHVRKKQAFYLGCVFTIVRRWVEHGKPRTDVLEHDFRDWAQPLDWIVQNLFGAAPLLDGHQGAQDRVSNPALTFLRNVALHVKDGGRMGESFSASAISELCDEYGLPIPHLQAGKEDHAARQIGAMLARVFREVDTVQIDEFSITRTIRETAREDGGGHHPVKSYTFSENISTPLSAQGAQA